ncbi:MAG: DNA polymerase III subunit gamma/tau [Firmicutes bacterium]|nr:DNA polymerase III subunit gamma/tau [Bacillota bacterium]
MDYKVLYRKYRPQDFDSVVGQEYTTQLLKNVIKDNKISHAYIFTGPRGTGKTSSAKIFARAINCLNPKDGNPCNECDLCKSFNENPDIIEIDAASNNGVDDIRELIDNSRLAPSISKYKVYIIDEFHMLSTSAFNALLLTLEEPPSNVVFILATTDIQSVPITVLSRCQRFDFKPITVENIVSRLEFVCKQEKIKITNEALNEIALMSNGGLRDALSILDQISSKDGKIEVEDIISNFGSISSKKVYELIENISNQDINSLITNIRKFKSDGVDYRILANKFIQYLKNELISVKLLTSKYDLNFNDMYNLIMDLSNSLGVMRNSIDPYTYIELIIVKYINPKEGTIVDTPQKVVEDEKVSDLVEDVVPEEVKEEVSQETIEEKTQNNEQKTAPVVKNTNKLSFSVDIRVNNCFANAKKNYLADIKEKWSDFLVYESNANKKLMSYIIDTDIVVASDKYAILVNSNESTVELINENIGSIEKDFKIFFGSEYKFVCLDNSMWNEEKDKYVFNMKNKIKYSIIDETEEKSDELSTENAIKSNNTDELESLASEIFGDNVEIK